eukprot:SM000016S01904  [mRNA]  locus=s16:459333:460324:- [translate_table: standard]
MAASRDPSRPTPFRALKIHLAASCWGDHTRAALMADGTFPYGKGDGAHSWHEGDDGTFWENLQASLKEAGGPRGAQGAISWLFLPGLFTGFAFGIEPLYLLGYTALFIFAFTGMEMAKPTPYTAYEPVMGRGKK